MKTRANSGFTLVEVGAVVIIVGLIAAGLMMGRSLLRQSEINSVMTDLTVYSTAANNFQQKYKSLPGDFYNAVDIWGAAGGDISDTYSLTCAAGSAGTFTQTCNGNGDNRIGGTSSYAYEGFLFWNHLKNENLLAGQFTGFASSGDNFGVVAGQNVPAARIKNAVFYPYYFITASTLSYFGTSNRNTMILGAKIASSLPADAVISAAEAKAFDLKYDDGTPGNGKIVTPLPALLANCATTSSSATAVYNSSTSEAPACSFRFEVDF